MQHIRTAKWALFYVIWQYGGAHPRANDLHSYANKSFRFSQWVQNCDWRKYMNSWAGKKNMRESVPWLRRPLPCRRFPRCSRWTWSRRALRLPPTGQGSVTPCLLKLWSTNQPTDENAGHMEVTLSNIQTKRYYSLSLCVNNVRVLKKS